MSSQIVFIAYNLHSNEHPIGFNNRNHHRRETVVINQSFITEGVKSNKLTQAEQNKYSV